MRCIDCAATVTDAEWLKFEGPRCEECAKKRAGGGGYGGGYACGCPRCETANRLPSALEAGKARAEVMALPEPSELVARLDKVEARVRNLETWATKPGVLAPRVAALEAKVAAGGRPRLAVVLVTALADNSTALLAALGIVVWGAVRVVQAFAHP